MEHRKDIEYNLFEDKHQITDLFSLHRVRRFIPYFFSENREYRIEYLLCRRHRKGCAVNCQ
jgi:hypothetical protein